VTYRKNVTLRTTVNLNLNRVLCRWFRDLQIDDSFVCLGSSPPEIELMQYWSSSGFCSISVVWLTSPALLFIPLHFRAKWFIFSQWKHFFPKAGQFRSSWVLPQFPHSVLDPPCWRLPIGYLVLRDCLLSELPSACCVFLSVFTKSSPVFMSLTCCCVSSAALIVSTALCDVRSFSLNKRSRTWSSRMRRTSRSRKISSGVIESWAQFLAIVLSSVK
jgi:hypothetical protein